ncbi:MAG: hypothetical protein JWM25_963 [Thermoleophilia bacterium]|nr:hypothetical protein [Thermoleophilia bacterium]
MHYARLDLDVIDQLVTAIGEQDKLGEPLRESFGGGSSAPNAATLSLTNAMFAAIQGDLQGLELRDLLSLHSDAHHDTTSIGLNVPFSKPAVTTLGPTINLEPLLARPAGRDLLVDVGAEICRLIDTLVPYVYAASIATDAALDLDGILGVTRPKMHVYAGAYQGEPALIIHTEDRHMTEWLWMNFFQRLIENLVDPGDAQLWSAAAQDSITDTSGTSDMRAAIQLPDVDADEAIEALVAFAPEFDWVIDTHDVSERATLDPEGSISLTWREVAPEDDDVTYRYEWSVTTDPHLDFDELLDVVDVVSESMGEIAERSVN